MHTAFIGIGSNLGDKVGNSRRAVRELAGQIGIRVVKVSSLYNTEPWGDIEQDWFINCVTQIETSLDAYNLLKTARRIEGLLGRRRGDKGRGQGSGVSGQGLERKGGPRVIDLDILLYNGLVLETDDIVIPHPFLHRRSFVLTPLAEIAPDLVHPVLKKTIMELLNGLDDAKRVEICEPSFT